MHFLQLLSLFAWSVACSSIVQGEYHVFIANVSTTQANVSANANISTNANSSTTANRPVQNFTEAVIPKSLAATVQNLQTFTGALANVQAPPILMSNVQGRPFLVQGDTFPDFATAGSRTCDTQYAGCSAAANQKSAGTGPKGKGKGPKDNMEKIRAVMRAVGDSDSAGVPKEDALGRPSKEDSKDAAPMEDANAGDATGAINLASKESAVPGRGSGVTVADCDAQRMACNTAQKNAPFQSFNLENVGPDPAMPDFDLLCAP